MDANGEPRQPRIFANIFEAEFGRKCGITGFFEVKGSGKRGKGDERVARSGAEESKGASAAPVEASPKRSERA
jgi:hypothetical protein